MGNKNLSRGKLFYRYVVPSIGSMLVTSLYVVVDGIFVGNGLGANALGAINIAGPYIMTIIAISMMITVGGATMTAISLGKKEPKVANEYFMTSMNVLFIFSVIIMCISVAFPGYIAKIFGANAALIGDATEYIRYFVMFCIFFCTSMALAAFVRNDGDPQLAFWGMVVGGVSNIFLDWLFIFPLHMSIKGPAIASGLGQALSCILLSTHFIRKKGELRICKCKMHFSTVREILKRGTPEFMNQLFQPVTVFCYNIIALGVFGEIGVSAFSVVYYIMTISVSVFIGLSQGIQPLISRSFGEGNVKNEHYFTNKGAEVNFMLALVIDVIMFAFGRQVISLFNSDTELVRIGYDCIKIYGISFLITAVNIVAITYFTATKRTKNALIISALRCLIFIPLSAFALPAVFGGKALWVGISVAELISLASIAVIQMIEHGKSGVKTDKLCKAVHN